MEKVKEEIKAIVFDIGGVLELPQSLNNLGVHQDIAEKLHISTDEWFDVIDTTYAFSIEGQISEERVLASLSQKLKISKRKLEKIIVGAYKQHFKKNKALYRLAFQLKKHGYKIGVLSDQWHLSKKALVRKRYIRKFDVAVISCDVGLRKPDPKIYHLLLKKLKLPAKSVLFIDNQPWNIKPAKELGLKTILFKSNSQLFRSLKRLHIMQNE